MSLEQQISKGIMEAMKAKDTVRLGALRNAKKYIMKPRRRDRKSPNCPTPTC